MSQSHDAHSHMMHTVRVQHTQCVHVRGPHLRVFFRALFCPTLHTATSRVTEYLYVHVCLRPALKRDGHDHRRVGCSSTTWPKLWRILQSHGQI